MGKAPAFQFYVRDWLSDPALGMVSASTRGIWMDCLCYMWESAERGKLTGSKERLALMLRATPAEFEAFLTEAEACRFCDISVTCHGDVTKDHGDVTLINRRMYREQKERDDAKLRKQRQRERELCHKNVTIPSSSSSSSSSTTPFASAQGVDVPPLDEQASGPPTPIPDGNGRDHDRIPSAGKRLGMPTRERTETKDQFQARYMAWARAEAAGLLERERENWAEAYPAVNLTQEIAKAMVWLTARPKERRSEIGRFLNTWFNKAQNSPGLRGGSGPSGESEVEQLRRMRRDGVI